MLEREHLEKARQALLTELRSQYVSSTNEALLDTLQFDAAGLPNRESKGREAHAAPAGSSVPTPTERGAR